MPLSNLHSYCCYLSCSPEAAHCRSEGIPFETAADRERRHGCQDSAGTSGQLHVPGQSLFHSLLPIYLLTTLPFQIIDKATQTAAIVDPVDPDSVLSAVKDANVSLTQVLTTHHHWDHAGGNEKLVKAFQGPALTVYGGDDRIGALTQKVGHGDSFSIGNLSVKCLFTPCHTSGHICYFVEGSDDGDKAVFTGDTLFLSGCGRFFEGTADQMYAALVEKLGSLPGHTKVYCGHEYSLQNLAFAKHVEPDNMAVQKKIEWCKERRQKDLPTVSGGLLGMFRRRVILIYFRSPRPSTRSGRSIRLCV